MFEDEAESTVPGRQWSPVECGLWAFALALIPAYVGLRLQQDGIGVFWPAAGIGAGMLLLAPGTSARIAASAGLVVALVIGNSSQDRTVPTSLVFIVGNLGQAWLFAYAMERAIGPTSGLDRLRHVAAFVGIAIGVPAAVGVLTALGIMLAGHAIGSFGEVWWLWFASHGLGILTVAPALMAMRLKSARRSILMAEDLALLAAVAVAAIVVIGAGPAMTSGAMLLLLVLIAPLTWWVLRRANAPRAAIASLVIALVTIWLTSGQSGVFAGNVAATQAFLALTSVALLVAGAQRDRAADRETGTDHNASAENANHLRVAIVMIPMMLFAIAAWWTWRTVDAEAKSGLERTVSAISEHEQRLMEVQEGLLEAMLARVKGMPVERIAADEAVHGFLHYLAGRSETIRALALADPDTGKLLSSNIVFPAPNVDIAGREYIVAHRDRKEPLHIGNYIETFANNLPGFTVSRRDPTTGLVAVSLISPAAARPMREFMIDAGRDFFKLVRRDGAVLAAHPDRATGAGGRKTAARAGSFEDMRRLHARPTPTIDRLDGVQRLVLMRQVAGYPVHVAYGMDMGSMRSAWLGRIVPLGGLTLLAGAALYWLTGRAQQLAAEAEASRLEAASQSSIAEARRKSEAATRASRDTFRHLVERSPFGIYVVDADFRLAQVSAGAQKIFHTVHPLIGRDFAECLRILWTEPFASEAIARFRHTLATGEPYHAPGTVERRSDVDEVEAYDWKIERIPLPEGRHGVVCHFYDLSERQRHESALRESESRFRHMADNAPVMVWVTEADGTCSYLAKSWYDFTGQTPVTGLGFGWLDVIHHDDRDRVRVAFLTANDAHEPFTLECRVRHKDGSWRWVMASAAPRIGEDAAFLGYIGSVIDITSRKEAEEALRFSEERFRGIFRHAATGISISNLGGLFITANPAYVDLLGYTVEELKSMSVADLVHPEDVEANLKKVEDLRNGDIDSFEVVNRSVCKDGETVWLHKHVSVLRDASGRPVNHIALVTDITDRKRAEQRQLLLMRELAHRGKNLFAVIQSIARRSLAGDITLAEGRTAFLGRLQALARTYSSLTDGAFEGAPLGDLAADELEPFAGRFRLDGPRIILTPKAAQTFVLVVHELATNAAKYGSLSVDAGRLDISWSIATVDGKRRLRFEWIERGGPPASPPSRRGFGATLITGVAGAEFDCTPQLEFGDNGLRYRFDAALDHIGAVISEVPARSRIRSPQLKALLDSWIRERGGSSSPPTYDRRALDLMGGVTIAAVRGDGNIEPIKVAGSMTDGVINPCDALADYVDPPELILETLGRSTRASRPTYEASHVNLSGGRTAILERLIVPYTDGGPRVTWLAAMSAISIDLQERQSGADQHASVQDQ